MILSGRPFLWKKRSDSVPRDFTKIKTGDLVNPIIAGKYLIIYSYLALAFLASSAASDGLTRKIERSSDTI